jgi:hypothetical protein
MGLLLRVSGHSADRLKISWAEDHWHPPAYTVSRSLVSEATLRVREVLNRISAAYMSSPEADYRPLLPELAEAGADLSAELFDALEGDRRTAEEARALVAEPRATKDKLGLTIHSDASIHIPWGFVYFDDPYNMPKLTGEITDFSGFWSDKFSISTHFNSYNRMPSSTRPRSRFRILLALHKGLHKSAEEELADEQKACFERLQGYEVGAFVDWEVCRRKWQEISKHDSVLYVYGHSDGTMIELDPKVSSMSKLGAVRFHNFFRKANGESASIFFINGCLTAAGREHNGFLRVTSMPGFFGFIGTEAKVPNKFATEYGIEFMSSLCEMGCSVQETYEDLRRRLFPLSLMYSCFAHPHFRVEPVQSVPARSHIPERMHVH